MSFFYLRFLFKWYNLSLTKKFNLIDFRATDIVEIKIISRIFSNWKTECIDSTGFVISPFYWVIDPCSRIDPMPLSLTFIVQSHATNVYPVIKQVCFFASDSVSRLKMSIP